MAYLGTLREVRSVRSFEFCPDASEVAFLRIDVSPEKLQVCDPTGSPLCSLGVDLSRAPAGFILGYLAAKGVLPGPDMPEHSIDPAVVATEVQLAEQALAEAEQGSDVAAALEANLPAMRLRAV